MAYINDEKTAEIRNALAVILRASFDGKHQDRLEDIVRQVGRIGGLLPRPQRSNEMIPKNKYSEVQRIVKEALTIILVEAGYILEEQELTELSKVRLNEIKKQSERIAKAITGI